jgi:hypothetical protein
MNGIDTRFMLTPNRHMIYKFVGLSFDLRGHN